LTVNVAVEIAVRVEILGKIVYDKLDINVFLRLDEQVCLNKMRWNYDLLAH